MKKEYLSLYDFGGRECSIRVILKKGFLKSSVHNVTVDTHSKRIFLYFKTLRRSKV